MHSVTVRNVFSPKAFCWTNKHLNYFSDTHSSIYLLIFGVELHPMCLSLKYMNICYFIWENSLALSNTVDLILYLINVTFLWSKVDWDSCDLLEAILRLFVCTLWIFSFALVSLWSFSEISTRKSQSNQMFVLSI